MMMETSAATLCQQVAEVAPIATALVAVIGLVFTILTVKNTVAEDPTG